ncbi:glycosyl transferase family 1 [Roseovarius atlanticus]|uniref:Glycosyl transferase family 1 n=1 Tax=Roseovarius atlanticus TaxID=1641875 RepID=A0A0T5NUL8_9RHOB|nr:glycosyltransferase family 4 protein [Roseovarius atlanticus]KRS12446.1 glycosyl transferase family 1 [Roseovarius atlanticus]
MSRAVFAIPGDKDQRTGGYVYDATVLDRLNAMGVETAHLELSGSFPAPSETDMQATFGALAAVPRGRPIIVDGLALGAMDPARMDRIEAPVVAMVHHPLGLESGLEPAHAQALLRNEAQVLGRVAHVIVPSAHIAGTVVRDLGVARDKVTVAHPGFERSADVARSGTKKAQPPLILSVGLLARRKGHDVLLEALGLLTALDWQAEIVGKVHDEATARALEAQADRLGLQDRVRFAGEVGADALQNAYARASLFALATRYEGYGMVLSEAMLHGLPVVSCRVGAVPETVGDAALLVAPDDPAALAGAIERVLIEPGTAERYAAAARARAQSLTCWDHTARIFAGVLERIAS